MSEVREIFAAIVKLREGKARGADISKKIRETAKTERDNPATFAFLQKSYLVVRLMSNRPTAGERQRSPTIEAKFRELSQIFKDLEGGK